MKTVAEWGEYWATGKAMELDQWVRAIQADALEAAAKVCAEVADEVVAQERWKLVDSAQRVTADRCYHLIRALAGAEEKKG